jgi:hypothetical protein
MNLTELLFTYLLLLIPGILIGFQIGVNFWHYYISIYQENSPQPTIPTIWRWLHRR